MCGKGIARSVGGWKSCSLRNYNYYAEIRWSDPRDIFPENGFSIPRRSSRRAKLHSMLNLFRLIVSRRALFDPPKPFRWEKFPIQSSHRELIFLIIKGTQNKIKIVIHQVRSIKHFMVESLVVVVVLCVFVFASTMARCVAKWSEHFP